MFGRGYGNQRSSRRVPMSAFAAESRSSFHLAKV